MKKRLLIFLGLILLSLPILYPFIPKGYFPTHDGEWAIVRLAEMHREVREGQIPPRWAGYLNHGFGYPLFLFTYPFPYYLGELFNLLGFGLVDSVKSVFILSVVGSAFAMYFLGRKIWGRAGGLLSTVVYLYAPYRLVNLYIRGSIGESLAMAFFPLLLFLITRFTTNSSRNLMLTTGITMAAFILTHNASVILFLPVLIGWVLFNWKRLTASSRVQLTISLLIGLLLSAHFWLPALIEKKYIALSITSLSDKTTHFVNTPELLFGPWHFGTRPPLILGILVVLFGIGGWYWVIKRDDTEHKKLGWVLGGQALFSCVTLYAVSGPFWTLPLFREIDFPWRMLSVVSFLLALLAGGLAKSIRKPLLVVLLLIVVLLHRSYIKTQPRVLKSDEYYATNDATTTSADELMPIWVTHKPTNRLTENDRVMLTPTDTPNFGLPSSTKYYNLKEQSTKTEFTTRSNLPLVATVGIVYFSGWQATVDDEKVKIIPTADEGLISFPVLEGEHRVAVQFKRTYVRIVADALTITGLICVIGLWIQSKKSYHSS